MGRGREVTKIIVMLCGSYSNNFDQVFGVNMNHTQNMGNS
jgi:hypothetical protein